MMKKVCLQKDDKSDIDISSVTEAVPLRAIKPSVVPSSSSKITYSNSNITEWSAVLRF